MFNLLKRIAYFWNKSGFYFPDGLIITSLYNYFIRNVTHITYKFGKEESACHILVVNP